MDGPPSRERVEPEGGAHGVLDAENILLSLLTSSGDQIAVLDQEGRIELMNPLALDAVGVGCVADIAGFAWTNLWPDAYRSQAERALEACAGGEVSRFRAWRQTGLGELKWYDATVCPIFDRITGRPAGVLATCRDVTSTIQTESILDIIVDSVPTVLFAKTASDGRYVLLSRDAEDIFGVPREEMLGKTDHDLGVHSPQMWQVEADVIRSGRICTVEEVRDLGRAGPRVLRTKLLATYGEEGPCHIIGVIEDVTEQTEAAAALQAAAERAEAANRAKSEFLANMSHEIRTPLNGVVGVADVLASTELSGRQREMVELIRSSGETLGRLLSDVLDLARIESGRLQIQSEPFHLAGAARDACALLSPGAEDKGLRFTLDIPAEAEVWVMGDVVRVKQVLTNFVSNAVKFTDHGEVSVRLAREDAGPDRAGFRIEVRDTGVGFDPALKPTIFGRFQQADSSITRRFGGTGLGLAICSQLAGMMGGEVDCDSTPGQGSVFSFRVPLSLAAPPAAAAAPPAEPKLGPLKVLAADDNANNRYVIGLILEQVGAETTLVADGAQALEAFRQDRFDAVLMDMQMPVMDGVAAVRAIRALEQEQGRARTPIFMVTANATPQDAAHCAEAGADRHLAKPITAARLLSALMEIGDPGSDAEQAA